MKAQELYDATYMASDPSALASDLHRLAQHTDLDVRMAVADNRNTHVMTAMRLAQDNNLDLRYALAENHQINSDVLALLAKDDNPFIADRAQKTLLRLSQIAPSQ